MADDRTPHPTSLTECPPDDDVPRIRKRGRQKAQDPESKEDRQIRLDHDAVVASERKTSEERARERPGSRLI